MENQSSKNTLQNKRVIIFGGSSGLGLAAARAAAEEGANVVVVSSNQSKIDTALAELPDTCSGYAADLRIEENIKAFFAQVGPFDHLVYTAGENITMSLIGDTEIATAKDFFTIRFWGVFSAIKYGKPLINEGGSITLMSGNFGQRPGKGYSLGATICGMMDAFTRAMAIELAPIRVNNLAPGVIKTELWNNLDTKDREAYFGHLENTLLLQRVGEAEDIGQAAVYLMKQRYTTGQSLVIDGGAVLI